MLMSDPARATGGISHDHRPSVVVRKAVSLDDDDDDDDCREETVGDDDDALSPPRRSSVWSATPSATRNVPSRVLEQDDAITPPHPRNRVISVALD
jgi:hypothetical protein